MTGGFQRSIETSSFLKKLKKKGTRRAAGRSWSSSARIGGARYCETIVGAEYSGTMSDVEYSGTVADRGHSAIVEDAEFSRTTVDAGCTGL